MSDGLFRGLGRKAAPFLSILLAGCVSNGDPQYSLTLPLTQDPLRDQEALNDTYLLATDVWELGLHKASNATGIDQSVVGRAGEAAAIAVGNAFMARVPHEGGHQPEDFANGQDPINFITPEPARRIDTSTLTVENHETFEEAVLSTIGPINNSEVIALESYRRTHRFNGTIGKAITVVELRADFFLQKIYGVWRENLDSQESQFETPTQVILNIQRQFRNGDLTPDDPVDLTLFGSLRKGDVHAYQDRLEAMDVEIDGNVGLTANILATALSLETWNAIGTVFRYIKTGDTSYVHLNLDLGKFSKKLEGNKIFPPLFSVFRTSKGYFVEGRLPLSLEHVPPLTLIYGSGLSGITGNENTQEFGIEAALLENGKIGSLQTPLENLNAYIQWREQFVKGNHTGSFFSGELSYDLGNRVSVFVRGSYAHNDLLGHIRRIDNNGYEFRGGLRIMFDD